jgi:cardiolipin synthase
MKLLVQPDDGTRPLVKAITGARDHVEIVLFRFEQKEIERALTDAVGRGVAVHALIAHTNRTGEANLRRLEMRLLAAGVTVARTADDLVRYHGKLMIIDRRELYLLAFNLTYSDIKRCRSFGVITKKPELVREAGRLVEADSKRQPYAPVSDCLVVSPANARKLLSAFLAGAKKELVIYDPKVSDRAMLRLLEARAKAGVRIRIIGRITRKIEGVEVFGLARFGLHTRTMVRDGRVAFVGSQSLRAAELDSRREVGFIFRERGVVARLHKIFEEDWAEAEKVAEGTEDHAPAKIAKKVAKLLARDLSQAAPVVNGALKDIAGENGAVVLDPEAVEEALKSAVKTAVEETVSGIVEKAVEEAGGAVR